MNKRNGNGLVDREQTGAAGGQGRWWLGTTGTVVKGLRRTDGQLQGGHQGVKHREQGQPYCSDHGW